MQILFKLLPIVCGFSITIMLILGLNPLARRFAWVDKPDNIRKLHGSVVPLTGGVAMMLAYAMTILLFLNPYDGSAKLRLMGSMGIMCLVGFWDDKFYLSPRFRLLIQAAVALLLVLTSNLLVMSNWGNLLGGGPILLQENLGIVFSVFCIVGAMNAINMIDGVDGLAGGVVVVALMWMAFLSSQISMPETTILLTLIGCVAAYLCFNMRGPLRKRASVFMGDAGSMMLGVALAWLLIKLSQPNPERAIAFPPIVGLWLVAVPLLDTLSLMISRGLHGKSPFSADRNHLHHIFQDAGLSDTETTFSIVFIAAIVAGFGALGWKLGLSEVFLFFAFLGLTASYYYFIHHTEKLADYICCLRERRLCSKNKSINNH